MKISEIVTAQRRRLGLKQYELAQRTGIAPSQISIFERGKSGMVTSNLEKVLKALDLHIVYDRQSIQRQVARDCAQCLLQRGIRNVQLISREELAKEVNNDEILLLPVVSEDLYRRYCRSEIVDETNTWNYFIRMVQDYILEEIDGFTYASERYSL